MRSRKKVRASKPKLGEARASSRARGSQIGIDSIETGMQLLLAFIKLGGRTHQLKRLAETAGMPPSKAHRYLVSLIRMGFVDRDALTGHYRLGPKSVELGTSAVRAMDAVDLAIAVMIELRREIDPMAVNGVAGTGKWGTTAIGSRVRAIIGLNSALVPRDQAPVTVVMRSLGT